MVNSGARTESPQLDRVFRALADATRRSILRGIAGKEKTVSEIAQPYRMSLAAVSKHLKVLERAGLIARSRDAQWRPCHLEPAPLKEIADWIGHYREFWEASFDRLDEYLRELKKKEQKEKKHGRGKRSTK